MKLATSDMQLYSLLSNIKMTHSFWRACKSVCPFLIGVKLLKCVHSKYGKSLVCIKGRKCDLTPFGVEYLNELENLVREVAIANLNVYKNANKL